jgi:hypothetical protein
VHLICTLDSAGICGILYGKFRVGLFEPRFVILTCSILSSHYGVLPKATAVWCSCLTLCCVVAKGLICISEKYFHTRALWAHYMFYLKIRYSSLFQECCKMAVAKSKTVSKFSFLQSFSGPRLCGWCLYGTNVLVCRQLHQISWSCKYNWLASCFIFNFILE